MRDKNVVTDSVDRIVCLCFSFFSLSHSLSHSDSLHFLLSHSTKRRDLSGHHYVLKVFSNQWLGLGEEIKKQKSNDALPRSNCHSWLWLLNDHVETGSINDSRVGLRRKLKRRRLPPVGWRRKDESVRCMRIFWLNWFNNVSSVGQSLNLKTQWWWFGVEPCLFFSCPGMCDVSRNDRLLIKKIETKTRKEEKKKKKKKTQLTWRVKELVAKRKRRRRKREREGEERWEMGEGRREKEN